MLATPATQEKQSWELEEGSLIGPGRRVLERLGGGNDVEVFLVWDEHRFALCAAKVLRPNRVVAPRALAHLRREGELLQRLAHPVLPRCYELALDGPMPHLLLEWVEGPTLRRLVRRSGALAREQYLPLAAHLAAALRYLGNEGLVHLDVKPANVIVGLQPRLIDLGIARPQAEAAGLRDMIGTDGWAAPEQHRPEASGGVGSAADVWGLGATLYFAVSGERPFPRGAGGDPGAPAPLPSNVPESLASVILAMLALDPAKRPAPEAVAAAVAAAF